MAENPATGTLYVTGFTAPKFTADAVWTGQFVGFFTTPMLAEIPRDTLGTVHARAIDDPDPDHPLLLPLSIVWATDAETPRAEMSEAWGAPWHVLNTLANDWLTSRPDLFSVRDDQCLLLRLAGISVTVP
jgi:hypothetical protein